MVDEDIIEEKVDKQKQLLMQKVDKMLEGIGPNYSDALLEELIVRLDKTVAHFHEEVTGLLTALKEKSQEQEKKLKELWDTESPLEGTARSAERPKSAAETEMSEWERRIEEKYSTGVTPKKAAEEKITEEQKSKKRGFFRRKKK